MTTLRLSRTLTALFVGLTITATFAAACGGDDGYGGSASKPAPTAASTPAAQSQTAGGDVVKVGDSSLGKILADTAGMTLYTFKSDSPGSGKSSCTGGCAATWRPLTTSAATVAAPAGVTATFATFVRDDGTRQVTYQGQPLYHFAGDKAPGDTAGDGFGGAWSAVRIQPSGASAGASSPAAASGYNY